MSDFSVSDESRDSSDVESDDEDVSGSEESDIEECDPVPKPIKGIGEFTDIAFHPELSTSLLAADINGCVRLYQCDSDEKGVEKLKVQVSGKPCRCAAFSADGEDIFVMTKDKIFQQICAKSGKTKRKIHSVHESSPYSIAVIDRNFIATGDEDGTLKLWDLRRGKKAILEEEAFGDYISDIAVDDKHRLIFAVSGDGTMDTYNVRQRKLVVKSKREKTDLLCAQVIKNNNKLVVGSSSGYTLLYNWEEFALASDRFPGHTGTVESIAKISEDTICTGSSDGRIRAIRILPNRFLGVVGKHRGFPIEKVRASPDGDWLASTSHDSTIRFWAVDYLHRVDINIKKKADCSRRYRRLTRDGLVNSKADFVADIEKDVDVPVCDIDSDDATTSEEEEVQQESGE